MTELLVVMVISVIVVGLAFSVLGLLQKNVFQIQNNLNNKTELRLLEQQLALDLQTYPNASFNDIKDELKFTSPMDSTFYQFEDEYIVRRLDTFSIVPNEKEFYFEGENISRGTFYALKLIFSEKERTNTIFLFKRNDALNKINNGN
ncbi:MAG: hypothetical protein JKY22_11190 [Flavobacteriaceae bacterium]|nr:hypothetical protein [Flavobacteriaceae bacterium]